MCRAPSLRTVPTHSHTAGDRGSMGQGHHAIDVMRSSDVAVTGFNIQVRPRCPMLA